MQIQNTKKGFTFIETMVAITVLLVAIAAPMSLAQEGITAARLAQDQIVAFYMAQEGVEAVRNIRDENKLSGDPQLAGTLSACSSANGCVIDTTVITGGGTFDVQTCPAGGCPPLRFNDEIYTYRTSGAYEDTKYTRTITANYVALPSTKDVEVIVTVEWPFLTSTRSYTLRENLLDW